MHIKLSNPERLKDLRLVDKHLILEQLAEQMCIRDRIGTELSPKNKFFAELAIGPDLLDRASGRLRYTPWLEHRIVGCLLYTSSTALRRKCWRRAGKEKMSHDLRSVRPARLL